ncbi:hypothetical protein FQN54_006657 [Arachnomyces sp. PD_36]|nr:hypothetical protein FQN54_006657 [Arachnomyces sp. PD_36]
MKHIRGLITTTKALQRTFLTPFFETQRPSWTRLQNIQLQNQRRLFYRGARNLPGTLRAPPKASPEGMTVDEDIRARSIQLVDEEGSLESPTTVSYVLQTFERADNFLVQVAPETADKPAVCKIVNKKRLREQKREKEKSGRTKKQTMKQIELNWVIDAHDLAHRMKQLEEFLSKGRKVEIIMARKKGKRRATTEEALSLVSTVKEKIKEMGAMETKPMQGNPPSLTTMSVEQKGK